MAMHPMRTPARTSLIKGLCCPSAAMTPPIVKTMPAAARTQRGACRDSGSTGIASAAMRMTMSPIPMIDPANHSGAGSPDLE